MTTIAVTGPESTGKTVISYYLATMLKGTCIPEFAREYITRINRPYTYEDIEIIGKTQVMQRKEAESQNPEFIILDTWLIITKVWFLEVYNKCPKWIDETIIKFPVDVFLLCSPDIPWVPDPLRENGGERRKFLFDRYIMEIEKTGIPFGVITGTGEKRLSNTMETVNKYL